MSIGSVFEPAVIKDILKSTLTSKEKAEFSSKWDENVKNRVAAWKKKKENQSKRDEQLQWEAQVVEYVDFVHRQTSVRANSAKTPPSLSSKVPFLGPRFIPPTFSHLMRREPKPNIPAHLSYLLPLNVIHPFFYPSLLKNCPQCDSADTLWDSWNATGARDVHGVRQEERALGYQLRCKKCRAKYGKGGPNDGERGYCFATTNKVFWEKFKPWAIPRTIPYFHFRCAVTHELFDLVTELRPSLTSSGLADHIEQLHLLEYWQEMQDYLHAFGAMALSTQTTLTFQRLTLEVLSDYDDKKRYAGDSISGDLITDIYLDFVNKSRREESEKYCRSRKAVSVSMDNTFKSAGKATVVDKDKERVKMMKGGVLSAINEHSETLAWRFCQSASPAEIGEMLAGIAERCKVLDIPNPGSAIVDNCCAVRNKITGVMPGMCVILDVYHFMIRYLAVMVNGKKNDHRSEVAKDIRDTIIKTPAAKGRPATYWPQKDQVERLEAAYKKWQDKGDVWTAAAAKVHIDQLTHVKKGCLARQRDDIPMDGSRIEGSHKGWNSLQRAQPSGLEMYGALATDHVHRRNIRIGQSHLEKKTRNYQDDFLASTWGSHHIGLVDAVASAFNNLCLKTKASLPHMPNLPNIESGESFGLVKSAHTQSFGGLFTIKEESDEDADTTQMLEQVDQRLEDLESGELISDLSGINLDSTRATPSQESAPQALSRAASSVPNTGGTPTGNAQSPQDPLPLLRKRKLEPDSTANLAIREHEVGSCGKRARIAGSVAAQCGNDEVANFGQDSDEAVSQASSNQPNTPLSLETPERATSATTPSNPQPLGNTTAAFFRVQPSSVSAAPVAASDTTVGLVMTTTTDEPHAPPAKLCNGTANTLAVSEALTRSQKLFALTTQTDPQSLVIKSDDEYYLFMDMRAEQKWTSYSMTARKWADAAKTYNERLSTLCKSKGYRSSAKNPRALMDKLGEIEPQVSRRIRSQDFKSESGTETFWRKHCAAVPAIIKQVAGVDSSDAQTELAKKRKVAVCSRCKTMMYPGPPGDSANHKKGYCADGVAQKPRPGDNSTPDWPQPMGIFKAGTSFNPVKFLQTVRELYDKVIDQSICADDYSMEDEAFSRMLQTRTIVHASSSDANGTGQILFRLFNLETDGSLNSSLYTEIEGAKYLQIDSLNQSCIASTLAI